MPAGIGLATPGIDLLFETVKFKVSIETNSRQIETPKLTFLYLALPIIMYRYVFSSTMSGIWMDF